MSSRSSRGTDTTMGEEGGEGDRDMDEDGVDGGEMSSSLSILLVGLLPQCTTIYVRNTHNAHSDAHNPLNPLNPHNERELGGGLVAGGWWAGGRRWVDSLHRFMLDVWMGTDIRR